MNVNINLNDLIKELYSRTSFDQIEISDGFDKFLMVTKQTKSEGTYLCYKSHARTIFKDLCDLKVIFFNQINDNIIFQYQEVLKCRGCKNSTINKNIELLIRCYKYLVKLGILPAQEFQYQHLKESLCEITVIDEETLIRIFQYADSTLSDKSKLIVFLFLSTGIRRAELARIRKENINLTNNRIYLVDTKCGTGRYAFYDPALKDLILRVAENNKTYLFEDEFGNHISYDSISSIIKRISKRLDIPHLSPHKFRHTYATMLLKNGVNIGQLRLLMGHSSLAVTHRYLDFTSDELEDINTKNNPLAKLL